MTAKELGEDQEDASLMLGLSTTSSTAPITTAGRELDALVAEKVMGFTWLISGSTGCRALFADGTQPQWFSMPAHGHEPLAHAWDCTIHRYSTDIAAAWEVADKLAPHFIQQAFSRNEIGHWEIDWCVSEEGYRAGYRTVVDYASDYETPSLPFAICLAALKAVGA